MQFFILDELPYKELLSQLGLPNHALWRQHIDVAQFVSGPCEVGGLHCSLLHQSSQAMVQAAQADSHK